jgi:hypothetical protein
VFLQASGSTFRRRRAIAALGSRDEAEESAVHATSRKLQISRVSIRSRVRPWAQVLWCYPYSQTVLESADSNDKTRRRPSHPFKSVVVTSSSGSAGAARPLLPDRALSMSSDDLSFVSIHQYQIAKLIKASQAPCIKYVFHPILASWTGRMNPAISLQRAV